MTPGFGAPKWIQMPCSAAWFVSVPFEVGGTGIGKRLFISARGVKFRGSRFSCPHKVALIHLLASEM